MNRDVEDLVGINRDRKWVRYGYREVVSGYEVG